MRKLALALAATAAMAFTAPAFAYDGAAAPKMQLAQADMKIKVGEGREHRGEGREHRRGMERRDVRMHRDNGRHEGWRRDRHHGGKVVIIKKMHRD